MFKIKRLYTFILQSFLPLFFMTFGICLFIVLMQFLWRYIEDFVGKGLGVGVLLEMFLYAGLNFVPLALPLAILLASLMTFGNMGERLELLAIKASGVSLLKAMSPLIILIAAISVSAFFFQNEAMPRIQVKFRSLLVSIKQKSPELDIPEGSFYDGIDRYSIYVKRKDPDTRMLHDVMIYDISKGVSDMSVFVCDSAKMNISETKDFLLLNLYSGQRFSSFRDADPNMANKRSRNNQYTPYSRENFKQKDIIIGFDANFNRIEESSMEGTQISMKLGELKTAIDSMRIELDSLNRIDRETMFRIYRSQTLSLPPPPSPQPVRTNEGALANEGALGTPKADKPKLEAIKPDLTLVNVEPVDFDSLKTSLSRSNLISALDRAKAREDGASSTFYTQSWIKANLEGKIRQYQVETHRKFTLSFACIIFFFIGAPLGAIIRKGGMGIPVIISVAFFIVYYIFENVGVKMARDGVWEIWQGMWLSSMILFPIGVFLTYKSMNDSDLFNVGVYSKYLRKILGINAKPVTDQAIDVNPDDIKPLSELDADPELVKALLPLDSSVLKDLIKNYQQHNYDKRIQPIALALLKERGESFWGIQMKNVDYEAAKKHCNSFRWGGIIMIVLYILLIFAIPSKATLAITVIHVIYLAFSIKIFFCYSDFYNIIDRKQNTKTSNLRLLGLYLIPVILYPYLMKEMKRDMGTIL